MIQASSLSVVICKSSHFSYPLIPPSSTKQDRPISGEHFVAVHVDQVGATEQLNPLLVGLSNMAISYLPVDYKLNRVLSATREVVRGVRYSLLVDAVTDTSEPIVCQVEVLEKPWILMRWGEKHRTLIHTNCTAEKYGAEAANEDKYSGFVNPVFVNKGVMDGDALREVEGQIVPEKPTKKPTVITNFDDLMKQLMNQIVTPKPTLATTTSLPVVKKSESTSTTILPDVTTTQQTDVILPVKPLDDASKSLLDDFFNVDSNYRTQAQSPNIEVHKHDEDKRIVVNDEKTILTANNYENTQNSLEGANAHLGEAISTANKFKNTQNNSEEENAHRGETISTANNFENTQKYPEVANAQLNENAQEIPSTDITPSVLPNECANERQNSSNQPTTTTTHPLPSESTLDHENPLPDSTRTKRQATSSEATLIKQISRKALRQLDSVDADDFKRILIDVLRSNRQDTSKSYTNYVLALRVANSHCIEDAISTDDADIVEDPDNDHICSINLVPLSTKICNVEVNPGKFCPYISHCWGIINLTKK